MGAKITEVAHGSPGEKANIQKGDILLTVNGKKIKDCLDYRFYTTERLLTLVLERENETFELEIKKDEYRDLGLEFETYLMDKPKSCHNKCVFCFIDQLPKGMRDTVYFKDDDTRLSFLTGNYVTLTNVTQEDIDRMIEQRISPINISVHTTDLGLRKKMLHHKNADKIMGYMRQLAQHKVEMNCQIVLCKGLNDGAFLSQSIKELSLFYPAVNSLSVVPVGLTKFREGLYPLEGFEKEDAQAVITQVEALGDENAKKYGCRIVYLADEFYLKAGVPVPKSAYYDGFPQIENGVGLMSSMQEEFDDGLQNLAKADIKAVNEVTIATGAAAFDYIKTMVDDLRKKCHNLTINVHCIENDFFGHSINVVGLITGQDLIKQLKNKKVHQTLLISSSMLRDEEDVFLDNMMLQDVEKALDVKIITCDNNGYDLIDILVGRNNLWQNQS